jgi:hypothetical protein
MTVFVGPNNSGKSRVLTEIERIILRPPTTFTYLLLDDLEFTGLTHDEAQSAIRRLTVEPGMNEFVPQGHIKIVSRRKSDYVQPAQQLNLVMNPAVNPAAFGSSRSRRTALVRIAVR